MSQCARGTPFQRLLGQPDPGPQRPIAGNGDQQAVKVGL